MGGLKMGKAVLLHGEAKGLKMGFNHEEEPPLGLNCDFETMLTHSIFAICKMWK